MPAAEIQKHLENSKVADSEPKYNQCLDDCIQMIVGQPQEKQRIVILLNQQLIIY